MADAIGAVFALAVGVGLSPIPIIAAILVLFSARARTNGPLFLLGWLVGLTLVVGAMVIVAGAAGVGDEDAATDATAWGKVALGALLLVGAGRKWQARPGPGDEPALPGWMAKLDAIAPGRAFGLGLALSANPKNLALAFGAGTSLALVEATTAETLVAVVVFVLVGSAFTIAAVGYARFGGDGARRTLDEAKTWLTANNSAVMAVLFLVFGAVLISNGLGGT